MSEFNKLFHYNVVLLGAASKCNWLREYEKYRVGMWRKGGFKNDQKKLKLQLVYIRQILKRALSMQVKPVQIVIFF